MSDTPYTDEEHQALIESTARSLHDAWRATRALPTGGYAPRPKPDGNGGEIDIANTCFDDLPEKWQAENRAAATTVVHLLITDPEADVESLAAAVHDDWLSRNADWAPPEQAVPFDQLTASDQEKDRAAVIAGQRAIAELEAQRGG